MGLIIIFSILFILFIAPFVVLFYEMHLEKKGKTIDSTSWLKVIDDSNTVQEIWRKKRERRLGKPPLPATAKCQRCGNEFAIFLNDGKNWKCGSCKSRDWEVVKK